MTYEITTDKNDVIIRVASTDQEALRKLLDFIELEDIRQRSQLSETDAAQLAKSIKQAAWKQVQPLFRE